MSFTVGLPPELKELIEGPPLQLVPFKKTIRSVDRDGIKLELGKFRFRQYAVHVTSRAGSYVIATQVWKSRAVQIFEKIEQEIFEEGRTKFQTLTTNRMHTEIEVLKSEDTENKVVNLKELR